MISADALGSVIEEQIRASVDQSVQTHIEGIIAEMALDPVWASKIETMVNQHYARKFTDKINTIDINSLVVSHIDSCLDRWQDKLKNNFKTKGIVDAAEKVQLTVMDGVVVVEDELASNKLTVENDAEVKQTLTVKNLVVKGSINTDNSSWNELINYISDRAKEKLNAEWRQQLVDDVVTISKTQGIEFNDIRLGGEKLVSGNTLNHQITDTNIQKIGELSELTVNGPTTLNQTVNVLKSRVGINTDRPEMALSVWDEEVSVAIGKRQKDQAYIGTTRLQNLVLGVNRDTSLEIDLDGLVTVKSFRVDRYRIGHANQVPGHSGTRGDIFFNSDPKPGSAFAWVCLGGFKWQALKAA